MVVSNIEIKWKYARYLPGVESDAKLERIKLLRGEPGGRRVVSSRSSKTYTSAHH